MKDYQEALDRLENFAYHGGEKGNNVKIIQELVNEKLEQESRKDKLIVGSEWECVVSCFANDSMYYKVGVKVKVLSLEEYDKVLFVRVKSEWQEVMFVADQFLLCFRPLKEGSK